MFLIIRSTFLSISKMAHATKIFAEAVKRFDLDISQGLSFSFNEGFMGIVGVDARHYQRVLFKHSVFAARFAGATSFGTEQMLYTTSEGLTIGSSSNSIMKFRYPKRSILLIKLYLPICVGLMSIFGMETLSYWPMQS